MGLAEAEHQPALGLNVRIAAFDAAEEFERPAVVRLAAADPAIQPRNGFGVVIEHVGGGVDDTVQCVFAMHEVGREHLDRRAGRRADFADAAGEMLRSAVGQVVAGHAGNHHMPQPQPPGRLGNAPRLVRFRRRRAAVLDRAEPTTPRADLAENHEGGRLLGVTLHAIRTAGLVADRLQVQFLQQPGREVVGVARRHIALQPTGKPTRHIRRNNRQFS